MLMDCAHTERGLKSSLCIRLEEDWYMAGREESALAVLTTSKYSKTYRKNNAIWRVPSEVRVMQYELT